MTADDNQRFGQTPSDFLEQLHGSEALGGEIALQPDHIGFETFALGQPVLVAFQAEVDDLLVMIFAFLLALIFNRGLRFGGLYMSIIFIPWMLSEIVSSVMFRWMFLPEIGILQRLLGPVFGDIILLGNSSGAMGVVISATVWRSVAFAMLLLLAGLQTIPGELTEAASIDGATRWQAFWKVTWPIVLPTTQVTIVFLTIQAINSAGMFLSITNGGPGRATEVLSLYMYREAIVFFNFGYGAALAVILFMVNAVLAVLYIRSLRSQVSYV